MSNRTSRREFARIAAVASAAPLLIGAPGFALGQTPPPVPAPAPPEENKPEEKPGPLALALASIVQAEYGQYLSADEMKSVTGDLNDMTRLYSRLRKFDLKNSDEPDCAFVAAAGVSK
ncbi:MAG: hypothetical protein WBX15_19170 [Thermoanaerobaculia bacterium]